MARPFAKSFYRSKEWEKVRQYVIRRDKYLCQKCGSPAEEVHHKIHLSPENINDPEIALSPENLVSLCRDCHFREHSNKRTAVAEEYEFDENGFIIPKCRA